MKDEQIEPQFKGAVPVADALDQRIRAASARTSSRKFNADEARGELENEGQQEHDVPVVYGTNGQPIACVYVKHPAWDENANICMTFHFIMLTLITNRSAGWAYKFRLAIIYFLDFMLDHNTRNPHGLHIEHIKDLTPAAFRGFTLHLDEKGKTRQHAATIKSAIFRASKESDAVPELTLPTIQNTPSASTEPLSEEGVASLTLASRQVVDAIRETIARRKIIDASEPYTFEELLTHFEIRLTKRDILTWVKYKDEKNEKFQNSQVATRLDKCDDPDMVALRNVTQKRAAVRKMLEADPTIQIPQNFQPNIRKMDTWQSTILDPYRVIKTLNDHGFPFNFNSEDARKEYSGKANDAIEVCDDVIKLILNKLYTVRVRFNAFYGKKGQYMPSLDELLELYYPNGSDMAGLAVLMMLQAGWNKETVMGVDKDDFEHSLTAIVEESIKIIRSEKFRAQGSNVPYDEPKQILAASDADNPYSLYNLILLAKEFTAPLAPFLNGVIDPIRNRNVNTLFAYMRPWSGWALAESALGIATLDYSSQFATMVGGFLEKYEVIDNGTRLTSAADLTRRLRVSWLYYNAESTPFAFLSQLLGHQSRDTTDISYDSSPQARARRIKRLRSVLEYIVELLRTGQFKGLLGKKANALAHTKLSIFFLPHLERALWACGDRYKPDWPGVTELPRGAKCVALDQCMFCSRVWILEESLPYLIERLAHIDDLLRDGSAAEFGSRLEAERDGISVLLDDWPDADALDEALEYRTANSPLLPRNLRDLRLIFRTGDLDE